MPGPRGRTGGCFGQTRLCPGPDEPEMAVPCRRRVREAGGPGRLDRTSSVRPRALHRSGSASGSSFVARIAPGQGRGGPVSEHGARRRLELQPSTTAGHKRIPSAPAAEAEPGWDILPPHPWRGGPASASAALEGSACHCGPASTALWTLMCVPEGASAGNRNLATAKRSIMVKKNCEIRSLRRRQRAVARGI